MAMMFDLGREMTSPKNSGKAFGEVSIEELRKMSVELTEEEKNSPFAKYYYEPMAELTAEQKTALKQPMPPEECYMPDKAGERMLNTRHERYENGYGILPNGVGFVAVKIDQVGRTDEKVKYYRENFAPEGNLFYKVWFPGMHLMHYTDGAVEDFGWGMQSMRFTVEDFDLSIVGIDTDEVCSKDPDCISIFGAGAVCVDVEDPENKEYTSMLCYTRDTEWGRELRVRYWLGLRTHGDGSIELKVDSDREKTLEHSRMLMEHCQKEYMNETRLMNAFWEETYGGEE